MIEENIGGNIAETPTADVQPVEKEVAPVVSEGEEKERMFSKAEVTELMKRRIDRSHQRFFERYKVQDLKGLDDLFGKASGYDALNEEHERLKGENAALNEQLSFLRNNINPERYDDVRAYFKGKNIIFNEGNLAEALTTHPEWFNRTTNVNITPKTTIEALSPQRGKTIPESDDEKMKRIFGV